MLKSPRTTRHSPLAPHYAARRVPLGKRDLLPRPLFLAPRPSPLAPRVGIVLLLVIVMLALFAVVALSFVFYAESEATSSHYASQAQTQAYADVDPELLLSYFLSQFIYDTDNLASAMRGHSLARTMYGLSPVDYNVTPYNGMGRLATNPPIPGKPDNVNMINYQYYPGDGQIRYPEIVDNLVTAAARPITDPNLPLDQSNRYVGGNVPWTYPDLNNMFLAAVDSNNTVLMPSFYRPWTYTSVPPLLKPLYGKYATLRPRFIVKPPDNDSTANSTIDPFGDMGCDVQNLDNSPGRIVLGSPNARNDSIWMDLGFGILTAPNGKKYKPLFASLVEDLDNRVNLGIHGNISADGKHASHSGWSRSEVNLSKIVPATYMNLFQSNIQDYSPRYGVPGPPGGTPTGQPLQSRLPNPLLLPPWYAQIDFDGVVRYSPPLRGPMSMQQPAGNSFSPFPTFPQQWYSGYGSSGAELGTHPAIYRFFDPKTGNNSPLALSNQEALMRFGGTNSPALTSTLFQALAADLSNPALNVRNQITLLSMDLNRPGLMPYLWQSPGNSTTAGNGQTAYAFNPAVAPFPAYPTMQKAVKTPSPNEPPPLFTPPPPPAPPVLFPGDFDVNKNWRSTIAALTRININQPLPSYPKYNGLPLPADLLQTNLADGSRRKLANSIYKMLIQLTGCNDPTDPTTPLLATTDPAFRAPHFLAQLAVNIVDYVDEDDVITQWLWYNRGTTNETVYGTELPRLVLNEVHCQIDNDPKDTGLIPLIRNSRATFANLNFWVELHNPFKPTPPEPTNLPPGVKAYPLDGGDAYLTRTVNPIGQPVYRLLITKANTNPPGVIPVGDNYLADNHPENVKGDPRPSANPNMNPILSMVDDFPPGNAVQNVVHPAPLAQQPYYGSINPTTTPNTAFYVVGPNTTFLPPTGFGLKGRNPGFPPPTFLSPKMSYKLPSTADAFYDILLQRLANPYQLPSSSNPYITVDFKQNISPNENRDYRPGFNPSLSPGTFATQGRRQPYSSVWQKQERMPRTDQTPPTQPANTFFRHNGIEDRPAAPTAWRTPNTLDLGQDNSPAFDWLVHLDRPVINGLELMHVSGYAPHRLLQKFIIPDPNRPGAASGPAFKYGQRAFWEDQNSLVYRLLEMIEPTDYMDWRDASSPPAGGVARGRVPGKININTIWDNAIFDALCDAPLPNSLQPSSGFSKLDSDNTWKRLLASRTPGVPNPNGGSLPLLVPQQGDNPFTPLGVGVIGVNDTQFKQGLGLNQSTILRTLIPTSPDRQGWLFGVNPPHPYPKYELLSKIYNNITLRSNCFAMWLTVGFFEVNANGQILGEIGRDENRQVRHRMFAIIDRTNLLTPAPGPFGTNLTMFLQGGVQQRARQMVVTKTRWLVNDPGKVNINYSIRPGMKLNVGTGPLPDVVEVASVDYVTNTITTKNPFVRPHPRGEPVAVGTWPANLAYNQNPPSPFLFNVGAVPVTYGNPGPQEGYFDPRQNSLVVPYFSIIQ